MIEIAVRNGEAILRPALENSGDRVAEVSYVELIFPPELKPMARAERYQPPGGMIRESVPDLQLDTERPGALAGWVHTVIFRRTSIALDRITSHRILGFQSHG